MRQRKSLETDERASLVLAIRQLGVWLILREGQKGKSHQFLLQVSVPVKEAHFAGPSRLMTRPRHRESGSRDAAHRR